MKKVMMKALGIFILSMSILLAVGCVVFTAKNILSSLDFFGDSALEIAKLELKTAETTLALAREGTKQAQTELDIWREKEILAGREVDGQYAESRGGLLTSAARAITRQDRIHALMQTSLLAFAFSALGVNIILSGCIAIIKWKQSHSASAEIATDTFDLLYSPKRD